MSHYSDKETIRHFLGLAGYCRQFLSGFTSIAAPPTDLIKGGSPKKIHWNNNCEKAFNTVKNWLYQEPVLFNLDFSKEFILQMDASDVGLGAVLSQEVNREEHPVMYLSMKLFPREKAHSVTEKEALAIKWAVSLLDIICWVTLSPSLGATSPLSSSKKERDEHPCYTVVRCSPIL
ncbi:unnamed protein product [Natator depressus]